MPSAGDGLKSSYSTPDRADEKIHVARTDAISPFDPKATSDPRATSRLMPTPKSRSSAAPLRALQLHVSFSAPSDLAIVILAIVRLLKPGFILVKLRRCVHVGISGERRAQAVITIPELAGEALSSSLAAHMSSRFGSTDTGLIERLSSAARLALDCIGNSDALYHNVEHTMLVTLVGCDIKEGGRY